MIDSQTLLKTLTEVMPGPRRLAKAEVQVVGGKDEGVHHVFNRTLRIGSGKLADFRVSDTRVSGLHLEATLDEGGVRLKDLGSKNGTFVGRTRVMEAVAPLDATVTVGRTELKFRRIEAKFEVPLFPKTDFHGLYGRSDVMRALIAQVEKLAASAVSVLIQGETGCGKERVAEALHLASARSKAPFVVVDCGAVAPELFESHLFGHEAGAFTGASSAHVGALERAGQGTLFLDELGDLPLPLQPKLLGALERKEIQVVGGGRIVPFRARVISATHRDLAVQVSRGRFREDLYFRVGAVRLDLPPLRERLEDVPLLALHFLEELGVDPARLLTADTLDRLQAHDWPGNVRELRNTMERAVALMEPPKPVQQASAPGGAAADIDIDEPMKAAKQRFIENFERDYALRLMDACGGNVSLMARKSGLDRISMYRLLRRLKLEAELENWRG